MHIPQLLLAGFKFTNSNSSLGGVGTFIHDRSLVAQVWTWISSHWHHFVEWLKQPHILALVMAFWITFTVVLILVGMFGFGSTGIGAGTLAAAFQSCAYGGFTPAGGIFATLTSMAMLGTLMPAEVALSAAMATIVTIIVWACGVGR